MGGKTGTTQNYSDGWFVGVTPNLVTSVWTGCEDRSVHFRGEDGYGGNTALPVFGQFMRNVYDDEDIVGISESDIFNNIDHDLSKSIRDKMNCNQMVIYNPEEDFNEEDF